MDTVSNHLCEADKIEWIVRKLKGDAAALWHSIVWDKVAKYEEFVNCFEHLFWSQRIQHKLRYKLEFGKFFGGKIIREQYVIK